MSARAPTVSILIPAYNVAEHIAETLDSVFAQTFTDHETIVVNDGSPDTEALECALAPYRDRIHYIVQENQGPSAARNTALRAARAEWVAFLDGDDVWDPTYLAEQFDFLARHPDIDLVYTDGRLFGDPQFDGETHMQRHPSEGEVTVEALLEERCTVLTSGVVARRAPIVRCGGFDLTVRRCEDLDLWLRLLKCGARAAFQRKVLLRRRLHPTSLSADTAALLRSVLAALRMLESRADLTPGERAAAHGAAERAEARLDLVEGKVALAAGDYSEAATRFRRANTVARSGKLGLVLVALRLAPALVRAAYTRRERVGD